MKKTIFMEKYPVYTLSIEKKEIKQQSVSEIIEYFRDRVEAHPVAKFIAIFDHYAHTKELNGPIMEGLKDAQNFIFCFGQAIPSTKMLAVRPRSIGICEFEDSFVIEFLEVPKEELHELMESWTKDLITEKIK